MSQLESEIFPDISDLITEDDAPVDNMASEKQQRLLTEPLYSSWAGPGEGRPFLAAANVGVFYLARNPAIVPDMFLSLDVEVHNNWWEKEHRSYFLWEFGKPPDLAVEIVSNRVGGENDEKKKKYAQMRVQFYVIYDPICQLMTERLTVFELTGFEYKRRSSASFPSLGLGLILWDGMYEAKHDAWLRWVDANGDLIPTGKEQAEKERARAEQERARAEKSEAILEQERERSERMAALLRQLGEDPDQV